MPVYHSWQQSAYICGSPRVEIEHYSVAYFDRVTAFEAGFTNFTQLPVVTSQFLMFIPCALRVRIEDGTGSRHVNWTREAQYKVPCEVNFHLQLAVVLQVVVLYLQ